MNHEKTGEGMKDKVFICFAAEDRYEIVEPIVYHLKNYGIPVWYDRYTLLMGDNRVQKNLYDGDHGYDSYRRSKTSEKFSDIVK